MLTIFQSLLVYTSTAFMLYFLGKLASQRERYRQRAGRRLTFWTWEITTSLFVFAFVSGVRWNVGVDHLSYLENYLSVQADGSPTRSFEPGFSILTEGMAALGFHYSFYFGLLAFLQLFFVYRAFKDERYLLPYIGLVVILGTQYLSWMNGIRQMLAATIFLYSIQFIVRRQWAYYLGIIFAASLIHQSALMLLPLYFLPVKEFFSNRLFFLIATVATIYIGMNSDWINSMQGVIVYFLNLIDYVSYADRIDILMDEAASRNLGPRRIAMIFLVITFVWYSTRLKERFSGTHFLMYYNLSILGFLAYNLLGNTHHIFLRPITYLTIFYLPVTAYLLVYLSERPKKYLLPFTITIVLACSHVPFSVVADYGLNEKDYSNYKFLWFHD